VTERQILPPGRKGGRFGPSLSYPTFQQAIEITIYFLEDRVARSLLTAYRKSIERPPVVSVTLELAASVSFQGAPARPARSEQPPASDSFGSATRPPPTTAVAPASLLPRHQTPSPSRAARTMPRPQSPRARVTIHLPINPRTMMPPAATLLPPSRRSRIQARSPRRRRIPNRSPSLQTQTTRNQWQSRILAKRLPRIRRT